MTQNQLVDAVIETAPCSLCSAGLNKLFTDLSSKGDLKFDREKTVGEKAADLFIHFELSSSPWVVGKMAFTAAASPLISLVESESFVDGVKMQVAAAINIAVDDAKAESASRIKELEATIKNDQAEARNIITTKNNYVAELETILKKERSLHESAIRDAKTHARRVAIQECAYIAKNNPIANKWTDLTQQILGLLNLV